MNIYLTFSVYVIRLILRQFLKKLCIFFTYLALAQGDVHAFPSLLGVIATAIGDNLDRGEVCSFLLHGD